MWDRSRTKFVETNGIEFRPDRAKAIRDGVPFALFAFIVGTAYGVWREETWVVAPFMLLSVALVIGLVLLIERRGMGIVRFRFDASGITIDYRDGRRERAGWDEITAYDLFAGKMCEMIKLVTPARELRLYSLGLSASDWEMIGEIVGDMLREHGISATDIQRRSALQFHTVAAIGLLVASGICGLLSLIPEGDDPFFHTIAVGLMAGMLVCATFFGVLSFGRRSSRVVVLIGLICGTLLWVKNYNDDLERERSYQATQEEVRQLLEEWERTKRNAGQLPTVISPDTVRRSPQADK